MICGVSTFYYVFSFIVWTNGVSFFKAENSEGDILLIVKRDNSDSLLFYNRDDTLATLDVFGFTLLSLYLSSQC